MGPGNEAQNWQGLRGAGICAEIRVLNCDQYADKGCSFSSREIRMVSVLSWNLNVECLFHICIQMGGFEPTFGFNFVWLWLD